jgi:phosphoglycerate kinase
MGTKLCVEDLGLKGKRVLVRVDFNVPLDTSGTVRDDTRIRAALPTIEAILSKGGKVILMSHLGRPKGQVKDEYRLAPVAQRLGELLQKQVAMAPDCIGAEVEKMVAGMKDGDILLLENLRFHPEEEKNDEAFSSQLARLGDAYVNDAFGTCHRAHASTVGVTGFFAQRAAGYLVLKELSFLGNALLVPRKPFVTVLGGAKVSDKIGIMRNLLGKVDSFVVGGGMAFTFLRAQGMDVGSSLVEQDKIEVAKAIMDEARIAGVGLHFPVDCVAAETIDKPNMVKHTRVDAIPRGWMGLDIGKESACHFSRVIHEAKTVFWNGPMGVFEQKPFAEGTASVARALAEITRQGAITVAGGGDTIAALGLYDLKGSLSHVSTGGGAAMEFLEGIELPGIAALSEAA